MPCEIGLSDGTKLRDEGSAADFTEEFARMAHDATSSLPPYGDWMKVGDSNVWFNPAHVVYVKDVQEQIRQVAWGSR